MAGAVDAEWAALLGRGFVILVTIGSLFPFDRLIRVMDRMRPSWPEQSFLAQIGHGSYEPANMPFKRMIDAGEFTRAVRSSRLIIAHAGMGSVIAAMEARVPIVILPRRMELGEHTTDHQMATARWLDGKPGIHVAFDDADLAKTIDHALSLDSELSGVPVTAPDKFIAKIRSFIENA